MGFLLCLLLCQLHYAFNIPRAGQLNTSFVIAVAVAVAAAVVVFVVVFLIVVVVVIFLCCLIVV